jgi:hypothetical protein
MQAAFEGREVHEERREVAASDLAQWRGAYKPSGGKGRKSRIGPLG